MAARVATSPQATQAPYRQQGCCTRLGRGVFVRSGPRGESVGRGEGGRSHDADAALADNDVPLTHCKYRHKFEDGIPRPVEAFDGDETLKPQTNSESVARRYLNNSDDNVDGGDLDSFESEQSMAPDIAEGEGASMKSSDRQSDPNAEVVGGGSLRACEPADSSKRGNQGR